MRPSRRPLLLLALVAFVAALLCFRAGRTPAPGRPVPGATPAPVATVGSTPSAAPGSPVRLRLAAATPAKWVSVISLPAGQPLAHPDPKFPHRLRNTSATIGQLSRNERAILLRNAFVDTQAGESLAVPESLRAGPEPGTYIVQARDTLDDAFRRRLQLTGARIISYIPNNAVLVQATADVAEELANAPETGAILANEPHFKLEPGLALQALQSRGTPAELLLTVLDADRTLPQVEALGAHAVARQRGPFGELIVVETGGRDILVPLARLPGITLLEAVQHRQPANDRAGYILGSSTDFTNNVPTLGLTGAGLVVNINDTGIDSTHPDLAGRVIAADPAQLQDLNGHGTHVAASIAGSGAQSALVVTAQGSVPNADFRGKAPRARLFILPIDLQTGPTISDVFLQETFARTNLLLTGRTNAPISNNSWGYPAALEYTSFSASYDAAVRDALPDVPGDQPVMYVFAAGNAGDGGANGLGGGADTVSAPGNAKNVITVGALESARNLTNIAVFDQNGVIVRSGNTVIPGRGYDPNDPTYVTNAVFGVETDSDYEVANFSSRGNVGIGTEGDSGRFKPDVVAPGTYILSARSSLWRLENQLPPDDDRFPVTQELMDEVGPWYRYESGTSQATPSISGLLAQLEEFYEIQQGNKIPPEGYKAILINGARVNTERYQPDPHDTLNYAGWGEPHLLRSLNSGFTADGQTLNGFLNGPSGGTNNQIIGFPIVGRSNELGLATGDARSFRIKLALPEATNYPVRFTLVWTDPAGNPAAAIKLVNDLDLVVTNETTGEFYLGNDFEVGTGFSRLLTQTNLLASTGTGTGQGGTDPFGNPITSTNVVAAQFDNVNNVERVVLPPGAGTDFVVIVRARRVNVNAVQLHPNGIVQDGALVFSSDAPDTLGLVGTISDAYAVPAKDILTVRPPISPVTNGLPMFNQRVGANSPLVGTAIGTTNQWHFYVFTNTPGGTSYGGALTNGKNVAFVTFFPPNLASPRNEDADIDLYVSYDPGLTNLVPSAVTNAFKSTGRGGTEFVVFTNAPVNGEIYYIGIKSEDMQSADYSFVGVSSTVPFGGTRPDGNDAVHGFPLVQPIPDGTPAKPGIGYFMGLGLNPGEIRRVWVQETLSHGNFPDLLGNLYKDRISIVLNNHGQIADTVRGRVQFGTNITTIYDDFGSRAFKGSVPTDGPGRLISFLGRPTSGVWLLQTIDDAQGNTGRINALELIVQPNDFGTRLVHRTVQPGECETEVVNVPPNGSKLTVIVTNMQPSLPLEVLIQRDDGGFPDPTQPGASQKSATIIPPGGTVSLGIGDEPPLIPGRYFVSVCNPNTVAVSYDTARFIEQNLPDSFNRTLNSDPANNIALQDVAESESRIVVTDTRPVSSVEVGLRIIDPRESDLAIHLVNPQGDRVLVTENRGLRDANGYGGSQRLTNFQHLAATFDAASSRAAILVDGRPITNALMGSVKLPVDRRLSLARDPTRGFTTDHASVTLDDVGFWRRPLGTDEVLSIYKDGFDGFGKRSGLSTAGLAALWRMDLTGDDALGANNLSLLGPVVSTAGQIDTALAFIGVTSEGRTPRLPLDVGIGFSLEGWIQLLRDNRRVVFGAWGPEAGLSMPAVLVGFDAPWGNGAGSVSFVFEGADGTPKMLVSDPGLILADNFTTNKTYAVFGELTNHTAGPIKFVLPPFNGTNTSTVVLETNGFESVTAGIFLPGTAVEGWQIRTNPAAVRLFVPGAHDGNQVLAMGAATLVKAITVTPGERYRASFYGRQADDATNRVQFNVVLDGQVDQTVDVSTEWVRTEVRFRAKTNLLVLTLVPTSVGNLNTDGAPSGLLLDSFQFEEIGSAVTYLPEEDFTPLLGKSGAGEWRLEVTDDRGTVTGIIDGWQLHLTFAQTNRPIVILTNGVPYQAGIPGGGIAYFRMDVPLEARAATNTLFISDPGDPLLLLYSDTGLPDGSQPNDVVANANPYIVGTNLPPILPRGQRYYLSVLNPDPTRTNLFTIRADLDLGLIVLTNGIPYARTNIGPGRLDFYAFDVPSDATVANFEIPSMTSDMNLFVSRFPTLPRQFVYDYAGTNTGTTPELISIDGQSVPVPLTPGRWFLGVAAGGTNSGNYSILASAFTGSLTVITNDTSVLVTNTVVGSTQYYAVDVPDSATALVVTAAPLVGQLGIYMKDSLPLPSPTSYDVRSTHLVGGIELIQLTAATKPLALAPGRYYMAVHDEGATPAIYALNVIILFDRTDVISLFDDVPLAAVLVGSTSTIYRFDVDPGVPMVLFEIYGLDGPVDLVAAKGAVPSAFTRNFSNIRPANAPELVLVTTNDFTDLSGPWYLSVSGSTPGPVNYTVRAAMVRDGNPFSRAPLTLVLIPGLGTTIKGRIEFNSVPGLTYQVQFATDFGLIDPWQDLGSAVVATGYDTSVPIDMTSEDARYYRVVQITNP